MTQLTPFPHTTRLSSQYSPAGILCMVALRMFKGTQHALKHYNQLVIQVAKQLCVEIKGSVRVVTTTGTLDQKRFRKKVDQILFQRLTA